jgi:hypothetical protein
MYLAKKLNENIYTPGCIYTQVSANGQKREKMKRLWTIFIIGIYFTTILTSCTEEENDFNPNCQANCTIVNGQLTTNNGVDGLSNVELLIKWVDRGYLIGSTTRNKAKTRTDANGNYELKFSVRNDELEKGYFLIEYLVDQNEFLVPGPEDMTIYVGQLKADTIVSINYLIPTKAFIEVTVLNQDQIGTNDKFITYFNTPMGQDSECCGGTISAWQVMNEPHKITTAGSQPVYIRNFKYRNGISSETSDTLTINNGQTISYTLDFNN